MITALRLHEAIAAVCPIVGVSVGSATTAAGVRIDYDPSATAAQIAAAQTALASFDFSSTGEALWTLRQDVIRWKPIITQINDLRTALNLAPITALT